jgi:hypothetical protein
MVEAIANSVEDRLIDGLSFKLTPGASYVTDRRSVTYHPQGSNIAKPKSGTKLIRFNLTGDAWMDPSTFRFSYTLRNTNGTKNLRPIGSPWAFFRRLRILAGGQIIEDIDQYNRVHELMHMLTATASREDDGAEAFGYSPDNYRYYVPTTVQYPGIKPNQSQVVTFRLLSDLLNQNKYLPIRYMPVTIELELVDSFDEPVVSVFPAAGTNSLASTNTVFDDWEIINCEVKVDMCTLDNALDNSYAEHLLSGKSLPINYSTFVSQMQTVSGSKLAVNVARALTRLKSVFVTFQKDHDNADRKFTFSKQWSDFFSPMSIDNKDGHFTHNSDGEFEYHLQIGSKLYPEYPIRSHAEAYYQLRKTLGVQSSTVHSFDVNAMSFRDSKFVLGIDTEKVLEAGWTGLNTRAGDLMRVKFDLMSTEASRQPDRMHILLQSDQIVEIRDTGCQVFD